MTAKQKIKELMRQIHEAQDQQKHAKARGDWGRWMALENKASRLADRVLELQHAALADH
jgi:hypothetical protein